MEVINLKSRKIINYSPAPVMVTVNTRTVTFSVTAVSELKLKAGQCVHFLNDRDNWSFIVNDDQDGFKLIKRSNERGNLMICNAALCNLIKKSLKISDHLVKFYVQESDKIHKDCPVIDILTDKPIDKIGK